MSQEYIENENARLEREQQFWSKEIVVKIEYKFCPNLTIIDTPGQHNHLSQPYPTHTLCDTKFFANPPPVPFDQWLFH